MRLTTRFRAASWAGGFTLLELAVVIFIMGLVMLIAMPYFGGLRRSQLTSEARVLASHTSFLYAEAGAQKVLLRIVFDLDRNRYTVERLDPFVARPRFVAESGPAGQPVDLPGDVRLRDVWVEGAGGFRHGTIATQFYPSGVADAALIHLTDGAGTVVTLAIDAYSGRTAIARGDLDRAAFAGAGR